MKAVMITFDQAHYAGVVEALDRSMCRGFTSFGETSGRGSVDGEPHYGSHAWPSLGGAVLAVVEEEKLQNLLSRLRALNDAKPRLGLRAFVWEADSAI